MQWSQIKTLFILCFLILDVFLLHHFINNPKTEYESADVFPREENLRINVNGLDNVPEDFPTEAAMLHAQRKEFTEKDITEIGELPDQRNMVIDDHLILSEFDSPLDIDVEADTEKLSTYIWDLDKYNYFGKDEKTNTHIFFQEIDRPIYFNQSGVLLIQMNEENEAVRYAQTILEKIEEQPTDEINKPLDAVSVLYFSNEYIQSGDEITSEVTLGYHNLLPLPNGAQVLAPTWEIEVNDEKHFYVNAIESHYTTRETAGFINEMKLQINDYFIESSTATIEIVDEEWEEEEIEQFLGQLFKTIQQVDGVE